MISPSANGEYYELTDPVAMPKASGFLWNETMMLHATCRGYMVAQFMQPEPTKYSHGPTMEAKTFILPEHHYYADHPGRFVYVKDEEDGSVFSAPHEPVRHSPERFSFRVFGHQIVWQTECGGVEVEMTLTLPRHDALELWRVTVKNRSGKTRKISLYPYFTVGYMSWMNQSAEYRPDLGSIVATCVTPYQKSEDYEKVKNLKDKTFFWAQKTPDSWETSLERFQGEGGLENPSSVQSEELSRGDCRYEAPAAVMQYRLELEAGAEQEFRFLFGPAKDDDEICALTERYRGDLNAVESEYKAYLSRGEGVLNISTPDASFDNFVNHWLSRQAYYHGATNRLSTDPQTRNFIQDSMGMSYIQPKIARDAFLFALSQQKENGEMPDGILLYPQAELKFINQVPHSDHSVWLPVCLKAYLDETADYAVLDEEVPFANGGAPVSAARHIDLAVEWLASDRDARGLNYIRQGDWCDPMNMVGYKGRGVSGWLTMAASYALRCWGEICGECGRQSEAERFLRKSDEINKAVNQHLWDGNWYARGITDDGVTFGVHSDEEGKIYLNAQSWAILCGAAGEQEQQKLEQSVHELLETPYGVEMLAPSYTSMREDIGRLTQKYPGTTENGSVYNHAAVFYIYALYAAGKNDDAWRLLRKMLPSEEREDILRRGQLPVFIPNYYRGAYRQFPQTAGRSSHLFNTGTIAWYYRCLVDGLFGLRGTKEGLSIRPQLPSHWSHASITRKFRGAEILVEVRRAAGIREACVTCGGKTLPDGILTGVEPGKSYRVTVEMPQ